MGQVSVKFILLHKGFYHFPFKLRHRKRWHFISERGVRRNDFRTPRWLSTVFLFRNLDMMLGLQSCDKWSLNNCDAIEIKSKGLYVSSVTIPHVPNFTSTLKLRSALFSWLMWVVFLAMRKVAALQVAYITNIMAMQTQKELASVHKLSSSCHPSLIIWKSC